MKPEEARREKLRKIRELGCDPWGQRFDDHQSIRSIRLREPEIVVEPAPAAPAMVEGGRTPDPVQHGPKVRAAGRIVLERKKGKLIFIDIRDWTGQIQLLVGRNQIGEENWALAECFDLGDMIGVDGELKRTQTGELTIFAEKLHFLTKTLDPPPEKYHGLTDPEMRQRMRHLDLIYGEGVLDRFVARTKIVQSIRQTLSGEGFVEIEGPTLHSIAGGAAARPFKTHHNALDMPLFMRIALELHLKRLLVGGMERVYELGRVYRNEGISPRHNPEFTMLEAYQAYGDYRIDDGSDRKADSSRPSTRSAADERRSGARPRSTFRPPSPARPTTSCSASTPACRPATRRRSASWPIRWGWRRPASIPTSSKAKCSNSGSKIG